MTAILQQRSHPPPPSPHFAEHSRDRRFQQPRPFSAPVRRGVENALDPHPGDAAPGRPSSVDLIREQARHLVPELPPDVAGEEEQQQPVEHLVDSVYPRFVSSRFERASATAASRRLASAAATRSPSDVIAKYRRRS